MKLIGKILIGVLAVAVVVLTCILVFTNKQDQPVVEYSGTTLEYGIKNISNLEAQEYHYVHVESMTKESKEIFGIAIPGTDSTCIYKCSGVVTASLDFSQIQVEDNSDETTKKVTITLPDFKVESNVDHDSFELYYEDISTFNSFDPSEVNVSFTDIEEEEKQNAIDAGLLVNAETNAKSIIESFIRSFDDYKDCEITFITVSK